MGEPSRSREKALFQAVGNLALPGAEALAKKPAGKHRPDQLALDFDEAYTTYVETLDELPTDAQFQTLQALDSALSAFSDPANREVWTEDAVKQHPSWSEVRAIAQSILAAFDWS